MQERDAARILDERARDYELYVSPVFSAVGDPERRADPAYLGHLANDGATCAQPSVAAPTTAVATVSTLVVAHAVGLRARCASPERVEEYRSEAPPPPTPCRCGWRAATSRCRRGWGRGWGRVVVGVGEA